jgi:hypothetical protein
MEDILSFSQLTARKLLFYQWREKSGFEIHFQALMHPAFSWGPTGRSPWVLKNVGINMERGGGRGRSGRGMGVSI